MRPVHALPCLRAHLSFAGILLFAISVLPIATFAQAGNFSAPVNYTVPGIAQGIAVGAFVSSKPNVLDIAVATQTSTVSILLGDGDGTFQQQYTVAVVPSTGPYSTYITESLAVGDFNGDGNLDLAVLCTSPVSTGDLPAVQGVVIILLGDGTGHFTAQTPISLDGADPIQVLAGDFNNDSKLDLAVLNAVSQSVTVLLGNGDGTFNALPDTQMAAQPPTATNAMAAADLNKDGKLDLAIAATNGGDAVVAVLLGNGDGTFQPEVNWVAIPGACPEDCAAGLGVVVGDFTNSGKLDVAENGTAVLLGNGDGTFQTPAILTGLALFYSYSYLATGDFNSDGNLDMIAGSDALTENLGKGNGAFADLSLYFPGFGLTSALAVGDLNGDGFPDLVFGAGTGAASTTPAVAVALNCGLRCTTTSVVASASTPIVNEPVTFTATVAAANGKATATPTGTVTFYAESTAMVTLGTAAMSGGQATLSSSSLGTSVEGVTASYSGDSNFNSSNALATSTIADLRVTQSLTATTLTASADPSSPGQSVTLTAQVTPQYPPGIVPTGTITFNVNGTAATSQPLNGSGVATFTTSALATGTDSITAAYSGDFNFGNSVSPAMSQIVGTNAVPFTVSASPASATVSAGGSTTFTLTLATAPSLKSAISFDCSGLPVGASCSFSPAQITPKGASATTTLTISTTGSGSVFDPFPSSSRWPSPTLPLAFLALMGFAILAITRRQQMQRTILPALVLLCLFVILTGAVACGGNSSAPAQNVTPQGTSQITVTASSNGQSQTASVSIKVN